MSIQINHLRPKYLQTQIKLCRLPFNVSNDNLFLCLFIFRIFWGLAIVTSLIFMTYFLFINQNQSTIVEISEKLPIYQIPFPAVTICPETKAKKSIVNVTDAYHNIIYNLTEYQYDHE
jgi:hypothetical protein